MTYCCDMSKTRRYFFLKLLLQLSTFSNTTYRKASRKLEILPRFSVSDWTLQGKDTYEHLSVTSWNILLLWNNEKDK